MNVSWSLNLLVLLFVGGSMCAPSPNSEKSQAPQFIEDSKDFSCNVPQPRSYYLGDLMDKLLMNTFVFVDFPVCIVVHRCDRHAGCCGSPDLTCAPVAESISYKKFQVSTRNGSDQSSYRCIEVEQHGKCNCIDANTPLEETQPAVKFVKGPDGLDNHCESVQQVRLI